MPAARKTPLQPRRQTLAFLDKSQDEAGRSGDRFGRASRRRDVKIPHAPHHAAGARFVGGLRHETPRRGRIETVGAVRIFVTQIARRRIRFFFFPAGVCPRARGGQDARCVTADAPLAAAASPGIVDDKGIDTGQTSPSAPRASISSDKRQRISPRQPIQRAMGARPCGSRPRRSWLFSPQIFKKTAT